MKIQTILSILINELKSNIYIYIVLDNFKIYVFRYRNIYIDIEYLFKHIRSIWKKMYWKIQENGKINY